jgi:hypothetical protein
MGWRPQSMAKPDILEQLAGKEADISAIADRQQIPRLVEALRSEKSSRKYAYEKALRFISEIRPELLYPYFDIFCDLLDNDNSFLKWGAIMTIANLTAVDTRKKFETVFPKYFAPISGPTMVTAANIIGSSVKIARAKPALIDSIAGEILKVEKARFQMNGKPSPECRNIAILHAIISLDEFYDRIGDKNAVIGFVRRQLRNTRRQVVKKAERFLRTHEPSAKEPDRWNSRKEV